MKDYLKDFDIPAKHPSDAALKKWRGAVSVVRNRHRRFRHVADLEKRLIHQKRVTEIKKALSGSFIGVRAMQDFMDNLAHHQYHSNWKPADFTNNPINLVSIARHADMKIYRALNGADGIAKAINVSVTEGVKSSDLSVRQETYGVNKYTEKPSKSFLMFIWDALHDLTFVVLIVCAFVLIVVGLATEGSPDGLGILLSVLLVVTVTAVSDYEQSLQFKDLDKEKNKISCHVTRDKCSKRVWIYDLVVGDIVHLSIGDRVPADGIFISGYSLLLDESNLTGANDHTPCYIEETKPFLLAGAKVVDGSGKMLVTAVGMNTEWGRLMETLSETAEDETPLQVKLNGVATIISKIGLIFAVLTFLVLTMRFVVEKAMHDELSSWSSSDALSMLDYFATAVTIIVVTVPEGLPLAVTLSLAFTTKKLMNDKALVRRFSACETMSSSTCICTDKTGTLTTNDMVVDRVWISGETKDVLSSKVSESVSKILVQCIFECTGSEVVKDKNGKTSILGTPTESAILQYGLDIGGDFNGIHSEIKLLYMEPFNSVKKKMSVIVALPNGQTRAFCKGAAEIVLGLCSSFLDGSGETVFLSKEKRETITDVIDEFTKDALRTLCFAYTDVSGGFNARNRPEKGYTLIAVVGIKNPLRPGVKEAVATCLAAGITVRMVTGDNINTAKAIARECGILTEGGLAVEGSDFRNKTTNELNEIAPRIQVMARSSPTDKYKLVKHLRDMAEVVAVTGDRINDAPVLHESDIGFALGITGTEVAKEEADVIVMDDDFATVVKVAKWGRAVYINIQKFVQFQLTVNIVALMINFVSACITGSAPLTAVQLLWVNLIMDTLGALALATEPPNDGLMQRTPVKRTDSFITKTMWRNILGQSIYQLLVLFTLDFAGKPILGLQGENATAILNTFIFNTFVFCQVFNEINSRDIDKINIFRGMFSSWIFMGVMISTVVFQVIIVEFLGTFASTVPLDRQLWSLSIVIRLLGMPIAAVLKCVPFEKTAVKEQHDGYETLANGPDRI